MALRENVNVMNVGAGAPTASPMEKAAGEVGSLSVKLLRIKGLKRTKGSMHHCKVRFGAAAGRVPESRSLKWPDKELILGVSRAQLKQSDVEVEVFCGEQLVGWAKVPAMPLLQVSRSLSSKVPLFHWKHAHAGSPSSSPAQAVRPVGDLHFSVTYRPSASSANPLMQFADVPLESPGRGGPGMPTTPEQLRQELQDANGRSPDIRLKAWGWNATIKRMSRATSSAPAAVEQPFNCIELFHVDSGKKLFLHGPRVFFGVGTREVKPFSLPRSKSAAEERLVRNLFHFGAAYALIVAASALFVVVSHPAFALMAVALLALYLGLGARRERFLQGARMACEAASKCCGGAPEQGGEKEEEEAAGGLLSGEASEGALSAYREGGNGDLRRFGAAFAAIVVVGVVCALFTMAKRLAIALACALAFVAVHAALRNHANVAKYCTVVLGHRGRGDVVHVK